MGTGKKYICINDKFDPALNRYIKNFPREGEVYTIRYTRKEPIGKTGWILNEIKNPYFFSIKWGEMVEPSFDPARFAEWDPEMSKIHEEEYETIGA